MKFWLCISIEYEYGKRGPPTSSQTHRCRFVIIWNQKGDKLIKLNLRSHLNHTYKMHKVKGFIGVKKISIAVERSPNYHLKPASPKIGYLTKYIRPCQILELEKINIWI